MLSLLQLSFLLLVVSEPAEQDPNLLLFRNDECAVRNAIASSEVAKAMVTSASVLFRWQDHPLFGELVDHVILRAYKEKPRGELSTELDGRLAVMQEGAPWEIWLETGLIALAAQRSQDAARCFGECLKDETFKANPYAHLLMGRSFLARDEVTEAQPFYADAINAASRNLSTAFYVHYLHAADLYNDGRVSLTQCESGPVCDSLSSPYPLEKAYGIYETLMYAWSMDDSAGVTRLLPELEGTLLEARPRPDSPFEKRRFDEATNFLRRVKAANAGDDYIAMILDEESCVFDRWTGNHLGVYNRLVKWRDLHPIAEYPTLEDEERKFALLSTHMTLNLETFQVARFAEAEAAFRAFLDAVPEEEDGFRVGASRLWLGYSLHMQRRYQEALNVYDEAASLLSPGDLYYPSGELVEMSRAALEREKER